MAMNQVKMTLGSSIETISICSFQSLRDVLKLTPPPLSYGEPLRQLDYLHRYLSQLRCKSMIIENHYIDRDYIEDYSVFYSRSFAGFPNRCKRIHFFSIAGRKVKDKLTEIVQIGRSKDETAYRLACKNFSEDSYLGFAVIKPLNGCPVGRTVLRYYSKVEKDGFHREFESTRLYKVHLAGVELSVRGLAFQQQDVGVSACATTALWSSIQKLHDFEDIRLATPAQITMLASQYTLPFGRPMPSEGLSIDQMCQSVQALGMPPHLFKETDFQTARSHLHSALISGFAPVLILKGRSGRRCGCRGIPRWRASAPPTEA